MAGSGYLNDKLGNPWGKNPAPDVTPLQEAISKRIDLRADPLPSPRPNPEEEAMKEEMKKNDQLNYDNLGKKPGSSSGP